LLRPSSDSACFSQRNEPAVRSRRNATCNGFKTVARLLDVVLLTAVAADAPVPGRRDARSGLLGSRELLSDSEAEAPHESAPPPGLRSFADSATDGNGRLVAGGILTSRRKSCRGTDGAGNIRGARTSSGLALTAGMDG
jgi:hypothetical protein